MSETTGIKDLGNSIAQEIFETFQWVKCDKEDKNWACAFPKKHKPTRKNAKKKPENEDSETQESELKHTHPSDQVYHYFDPYEGREIYLNIDLKSYAKNSLATYSVIGDLRSLGKAIECAPVSDDFKEMFVSTKGHFHVDGILFVYNHDQEYDKDFDAHLERKVPSSGISSLTGDGRIFIFGPRDIAELYSIAKHFNAERGKNHHKVRNSGFLSPDLKISKVEGRTKLGPATVDMLCSNWVFARIETTDHSLGNYLYLKSQEVSREYFKYMFDAILELQLLEDFRDFYVIDLYATEERENQFTSALDAYVTESHGVTDESISHFKERMKKVTYVEENVDTPPYSLK